MVITIVGDDMNPTFKVAWIVPMLIFPFFGWVLYFLFGRRKTAMRTQRRYFDIFMTSKRLIPSNEEAMKRLREESKSAYRQCRYIQKTANSTVYENTETKFFPTGESFFKTYLEELKKAERYIFLEYFIISEGQMWDEILEILTEKQQQGIDIRILYDDMGTINTLEKGYHKKLIEMGFKVSIFNPYKPSLDSFMNYRDHRKITVIDGKVAFTGGLNLADEYINEKVRFGYWKDCAIMLKGDAVQKMTQMFLRLWYFSRKKAQPVFKNYMESFPAEHDGYVMPFGDGPMSGHLTGKHSYINIINSAKKYIYISTPYLILDNEMITALSLAAQSGVDVRILTPHIPDKWYVHTITRSNYSVLIQAGVRIFEYTPGFLHAKTIIADDEFGIVGTANFDFRSFYLHFENGVFMFRSKAIPEVKTDYEEMLSESQEITPEDCVQKNPFMQFGIAFLKMFSPFF